MCCNVRASRSLSLVIDLMTVFAVTKDLPTQPFLLAIRFRVADQHPFIRVTPVDFIDREFFAHNNHPTLPSICSSISRFNSTAYSIGSSFTKGSMKPVTIIDDASTSLRPRLMR